MDKLNSNQCKKIQLHCYTSSGLKHTNTSHKHHQTIRPCLSPRWRNPCKVFVVSGVVYGSGFHWWVEPTKGIAQVQQRRPPSILLSCIPRKLSTKQFLLVRKLDDPTKSMWPAFCREGSLFCCHFQGSKRGYQCDHMHPYKRPDHGLLKNLAGNDDS